jgi:hypothetical protein
MYKTKGLNKILLSFKTKSFKSAKVAEPQAKQI